MSHRLFLDAVLYVARTGIPWPDLPARFGKYNSIWRRFDRWAAKGRWDPILAALRDPDLDLLILDSTAVRAHPCAGGAKKSGTAPAASPSRPSAVAGAASAPRSTAVSTGSATRLS
jgi:transposase